MLESISIENFRCFDSLKIKGFRNVNLIGGQNNSGKTALLEALLLAFFPSPKSIEVLRQFRNENDSLIKKATEKVWNYFFYNQDKTEIIKFISNFSQEQTSSLELLCTKDVEIVLETISNSLGNGNSKISDLISTKFSDILLLNVRGNIQKADFNYFLLPDKEDSDIAGIGKMPKRFDYLPFLHSSLRINDDNLSNLYSLAKENKKIKILNDVLNILDNRIIGSEIDAPGGEPVIKLLLNDEQSFPLAMFGDAVRKITELILIIVSASNKIILIDEIENGIHFTKHKDLWTKLFQIVGNDMQIFATSHSLEMIKAFNDVAYQTEFEEKAMYFEIARTQKTKKTIANPMDMEILNSEIVTGNSFRGE